MALAYLRAMLDRNLQARRPPPPPMSRTAIHVVPSADGDRRRRIAFDLDIGLTETRTAATIAPCPPPTTSRPA